MKKSVLALTLVLMSLPAAVHAAYAGVTFVGPGRAYAGPAQALGDTAAWCRPANDVTTPCLIKMDPGTYDLGATQLYMKPYVDIEGSGETATTLLSSGATGIYFGFTTVRAELRRVSLVFGNPLGTSAGVLVYGGTEAKLSHVALSTSGGLSGNVGVNVGGKCELDHVTIAVSGNNTQTGVSVGTGVATSTVTINESAISAESWNGYPVASVSAYGGTFRIVDSTISALGSHTNTIGVSLRGGTVLLEDSYVESPKRAIVNDDLNGQPGNLRFLASRVVAPSAINSAAVINDTGGSTALFGASTIDGPVYGSGLTCVDSVDGNGTLLTEACLVP